MKTLQISVGIIRNSQGEIFITQRAADAHMANKLEFPGGKIEEGESSEQALVRALQEEVGITAKAYSLVDKLGRRAVGERRAAGPLDCAERARC